MMLLGTAKIAERASRTHKSPSLLVESGGGEVFQSDGSLAAMCSTNSAPNSTRIILYSKGIGGFKWTSVSNAANARVSLA